MVYECVKCWQRSCEGAVDEDLAYLDGLWTLNISLAWSYRVYRQTAGPLLGRDGSGSPTSHIAGSHEPRQQFVAFL